MARLFFPIENTLIHNCRDGYPNLSLSCNNKSRLLSFVEGGQHSWLCTNHSGKSWRSRRKFENLLPKKIRNLRSSWKNSLQNHNENFKYFLCLCQNEWPEPRKGTLNSSEAVPSIYFRFHKNLSWINLDLQFILVVFRSELDFKETIL